MCSSSCRYDAHRRLPRGGQVLRVGSVLLAALGPLRVRPNAYLIGLAMGANVSSVLSVTGNPQNMLVGIWSGTTFGGFLVRSLPVAAGGLAITSGYLRLGVNARGTHRVRGVREGGRAGDAVDVGVGDCGAGGDGVTITAPPAAATPRRGVGSGGALGWHRNWASAGGTRAFRRAGGPARAAPALADAHPTR
ncbi:MAG: SLC13 family permease [Gemmatimonadales bacterium]